MAGTGFPCDPLRDQFFLEDAEILGRIAQLAGLSKEDTVLEIGAGDGRLTEQLARRAGKVIAVEIDERLRPVLSARFRKKRNVQLLFGDALRLLPGLSGRYSVIVSNPPYSISEPLVKLLFRQGFRQALLTLPAGFVSALAANPEEPSYSKLSLFAQAFFGIEAVMPVGRSAWRPVPGTESVVVRLTPKAERALSARERIARAMALQEDKKLSNALREALSRAPGGTKRKAREAVSKAGIEGNLLSKKISSMSLKEIQETLGAFG